MRVCHCALPAMNGNADCCKYCNNNIQRQVVWGIDPNIPFNYLPQSKKEIIEKFDKDGNLVERIIIG